MLFRKENNIGAEGYGLDKTLLDGEEIKYYKGDPPTDFDHEYKGPRITRETLLWFASRRLCCRLLL